MINNFNKLIITKWIKSFTAVFSVLFLFVCFGDVVDGMVRPNVPLIPVLKNLLLRWPDYINKILPIVTLSASLFTLNYFRSTNELVAMISLGQKPLNFIFIFFQLSLFIAVFSFACAGLLDPFTKKIRHEFLPPEQDFFFVVTNKGLIRSSLDTGKIWYKSKDYFVSFSAYDESNKQLNDISVMIYDNNFVLSKIVYAKQATYVNKGWIFNDGYELDNINLKKFPKLRII
jgi:lipopolysaccharide export system permease protein